MSKNKTFHNTLHELNLKDERSFEALYVAYYEKLCVYLSNYTTDKKIIEDVVQDTFVTIWKKRHEIEITNSVKSYLYRAVYNKLIDGFRKTKKVDTMLSEYYHTALIRASNSDTDYQTDRLLKLDVCIDKLPLRCKNVFIANKISGKKYQEVAFDLDISLKTVEGHITRAFKLIKQCMDNPDQSGIIYK